MSIESLFENRNISITISTEELRDFGNLCAEKAAKAMFEQMKQDEIDACTTYTLDEVSDMLGKTKKTIWKWCVDGKLVKHKNGKAVYFYKKDIDPLRK